jgi:parallel beta-helix repeat protein
VSFGLQKIVSKIINVIDIHGKLERRIEMGKKIVSGTMLSLLLISMLILAFDIQPVEASGTIWIRSDGSVDPDTAPISTVDNVTYTFTDNIYDEIVVERSNIIVDGNGYTLQGSGSGCGFALGTTNNVTIKRTKIKGFAVGIGLFWWSSNNMISGNIITQNSEDGIGLYEYCHNNTISGNSIAYNGYGVRLFGLWGESPWANTISGNSITYNGYGVWIWRDSPFNSIVGNSIRNNGYGIWLPPEGFANTISGNSITYNGYGIWLSLASCYNAISENSITDNGCGVGLFEYSHYNTISGNIITRNNQYGIIIDGYSSYNTISGNDITHNDDYGIELSWGSWYNTISENDITQNNECGISIDQCDSNTVFGNNVTSNGYGIWFHESCGENTIFGNSIVNNGCGIRLDLGSAHNTISGNSIADNGYGIWSPSTSGSNTISGNNITNNTYGIWLDEYSCHNIITGNSITNNGCGVWLWDESFSNTISGNDITQNNEYGIVLDWYSFSNTVSENNIVNNGCGIMLFEYSRYNTISENSITDNGYGIWLSRHSRYNTISRNSITNNDYGIWLHEYSCVNTISGNSIVNNGCGIRLRWYSCYNTISGNDITQNNQYGIVLGEWSSDNTISGNNVTNNGCGIWLIISSNNAMYYNNFVNNGEQVISWATNVWDDGYPSGGNYWSDYSIRYPTVVDDYHGENQDILGSDGIWDSPYVIDAENKDNYPFVNPWFLDLIPPVADAGPDQIAHEDTPVILNGEASSDNVGIVSYVWTFTDVIPQTLTGVNPTYTFQTPGIYTVTLNVTDAAGNWDTDTVTITVLDVTSPVADTGPDQTIDEDTLVTLEGWRSTDNVGVTSWTWTFTDVTPQTLTGENVTYTFTTPGIYTVTLEVSDAAGNRATDTVTITVLSLNPEESIQRLMETIESWNLVKGTENSLTSKLEEAIHLSNIGNENGAIHKLTDFMNQVEALREKKLTIERADYLTAEAQRIIDLIKRYPP